MENSTSSNLIKLSTSKSDLNSNSQKPFKIRRRKTYLVEKNSLISQNEKKNRNSKGNISYNTLNQRRSSFRTRRKSFIALTIKNFKGIEEDIKMTLQEMRRNCLWELRRQNNGGEFNFFEDNNNKSELGSDNGKIKGKFTLKFLEDLNINDNENENEPIKVQRSNTFSTKLNKKKKDILSSKNDSKNEDVNYENKSKTKKKFVSSNALLKVKMHKKKYNPKEKFRFLSCGRKIIDSHDESESDEDPESGGFLIILKQSLFLYMMLL